MRVAYICADPGIPVFGTKGASVHVQEVVKAMLSRGLDVTLFAQRLGGDVPEALKNVPIRKLETFRKTRWKSVLAPLWLPMPKSKPCWKRKDRSIWFTNVTPYGAAPVWILRKNTVAQGYWK